MLLKWEQIGLSLPRLRCYIKGGQEMRTWVRSAAYRSAIRSIVDARSSAGLTQRDLAKKLGKSPSFVGKIEAGERRIDVIEFVAIARAIGISEAKLLEAVTAELPKRLEL